MNKGTSSIKNRSTQKEYSDFSEVGLTSINNESVKVSASVDNRTPNYLARPNFSGKATKFTIIVAVIVNSSGHVTKAGIYHATTNSETLHLSAIEAAKKSSFSTGGMAQPGLITYEFEP